MVDTQWWNERLEAWSHEGFDIESFRNSLRANPSQASQMLIGFEKKVSRNRSLRRRVIDSSMSRDKKIIDGKARFVFVSEVGQAVVHTDVPDSLIRDAVQRVTR